MATSNPAATNVPISLPANRGAPAPTSAQAAVSPPTKPELKSWWKKFRKTTETDDEKGKHAPPLLPSQFRAFGANSCRLGLVRSEYSTRWLRRPEADKLIVDIAPGIFGVTLAESIRYANVAISLSNDKGESFIYGYVPIVVAKCGVFLKEKGQLHAPVITLPLC